MTVKQLREFMLWLRKEKIGYTTLSAGGITIDGVVDGKIDRPVEKIEETRRPTMFERYGAELLSQPQAAKPSDVIPDEAMDD